MPTRPKATILEKTKRHIAYIRSLPKTEDTYGLIHYDLHEVNLLVEGEKIEQHFENQGYKNDLDLINDFVSSLINLLKGNPPPKQWIKGDRINLIDLGPL